MLRKRSLNESDAIEQDDEKKLEEFLFGTSNSKTFNTELDEKTFDYVVDRQPLSTLTSTGVGAVWKDEDDERVAVDLNKTNRLKKLKNLHSSAGKSVISGVEFTNLLQERFQGKRNAWTSISTIQEFGTNTLDDVFNSTDTVIKHDTSNKWRPMPNGKISIRRVLDANAKERSGSSITTINFHSRSKLFLAGSEDKHVNIFSLDGDKNDHKIDIKFPDMIIRSAKFSFDRNEIYASGRKSYFYSYDIESGVVSKIQSSPTIKTTYFEHMFMSPNGSRIAFLGSKGYVHIADGNSKQWMADLKMNSSARSGCFLDDNYCVTAGFDAEMYLWDLRYNNGKCISRFTNEDGTPVTSLAAYSPSPDYSSYCLPSSILCAGGSSGVATIYNDKASVEPPTSKYHFSSTKSIMNLTTKITTSHFHPSGQMLAVGSKELNGQMKIIHLPSCSTFSNWPSAELPLKKVSNVEFSPDGKYLAVANNKGKVLLFEISNP